MTVMNNERKGRYGKGNGESEEIILLCTYRVLYIFIVNKCIYTKLTESEVTLSENGDWRKYGVEANLLLFCPEFKRNAPAHVHIDDF